MFVIIFCWDVSFWVGGDGSSEIIDLINTSIIFPSFWRSIYLTMKTSTEWKVNIFVGIWKIPQHNSSTPEKLPPMKFRPGQLPPGHLRPGQLPQKSPPWTITPRAIALREILASAVAPWALAYPTFSQNNSPLNNYPRTIFPLKISPGTSFLGLLPLTITPE